MNKNYLGIDVAKLTIACCLITESGQFENEFANDIKGFQQLQKWLQKHKAKNLHCCCEATGIYYESMAEYLHHRYTISVVNPRKIKGFGVAVLMRSKTDKQDAKLIAQYCKTMNPQAWQPSTQENRQLQNLIKLIDRTKKQRASEQTKQQTAPDYIKSHIQSTIEHFTKLIQDLETQLKAFYKQNPEYKQNQKRLKTIPGIGENTASVLLAVLTAGTFEKASQFIAYIGLDPRLKQSGTSVNGRQNISKIGKSNIRSSLYMPAMVAYRDGAFAAFVARLKKAGKKPKVIIVALMRKLAVIAFTLFQNGQDFEVERYK